MNNFTRKVVECWSKVGERSESVSVDNEALRLLAIRLANQDLKAPDWQLPDITPANNRAFVSQSFYTCAIDFAFTHFGGAFRRYQFKNNGPRGSLAVAQCFYNHFGETEVEPDEILYITRSLSKCKSFFRGVTAIPLAGERRQFLSEAAYRLRQWFAGDPMLILKDSQWRAAPSMNNSGGALSMLQEIFPKTFASDINSYADGPNLYELSFLKRAQLWLLVYQGRAMHSDGELPLLEDPENLGPIADCAVPNALRSLGILKYGKALAECVDGRLEIPSGSRSEIGIRMATVYAVQQLLDQINVYKKAIQRSLISMVELDYFLWCLGRRAKIPYHLTRTTAY